MGVPSQFIGATVPPGNEVVSKQPKLVCGSAMPQRPVLVQQGSAGIGGSVGSSDGTVKVGQRMSSGGGGMQTSDVTQPQREAAASKQHGSASFSEFPTMAKGFLQTTLPHPTCMLPGIVSSAPASVLVALSARRAVPLSADPSAPASKLPTTTATLGVPVSPAARVTLVPPASPFAAESCAQAKPASRKIIHQRLESSTWSIHNSRTSIAAAQIGWVDGARAMADE